METNAKYFLVGLGFLLLSVLAIAIFVWFKRYGSYDDYALYAADFQSHSLSGLQKGSAVSMRGIVVGRVKEIKFTKGDIETIRTLLEIEKNVPIKRDTQAIVVRNLLTGFANIDLVNSSKESALLAPARPGESYPLIEEGPARFDVIKSNIPELIERSNHLISQIEKIFSDKNVRNFSILLSDLRTLSTALTRGENSIVEVASSFSQLLKKAEASLPTLDRSVKQIKDALVMASKSVGASADEISEDFGEAAYSLRQSANRFNNPRSLIAGPALSELGPGER